MDVLPLELINSILQFLNAKELLQLSCVSHLYNSRSNDLLKWINMCFTDPKCQPLLQAAMLKEDLLSKTIDAKSLYESIQANDVQKIQALLFPNKIREFVLYAPFYQKNIPQFFPPAGRDGRNLYLTAEAAKRGTPNAVKVKHWLRVKIEIEKDKFVGLYSNQLLLSQQSDPTLICRTPAKRLM